MTITAKIILDSISEAGKRLTTMELYYNRYIHSELMTHRAFSRNAGSSRAIPVKRMIEMIREDTAMPIHWGSNKPGMQAGEEIDTLIDTATYTGLRRKYAWLEARDRAIEIAEGFAAAGYAKQVTNRLLEPFMHIKGLVSGTEWGNFFELRDHPDAQPEIQALARAMKQAMRESEPKLLKTGEWHMPYLDLADRLSLPLEHQRRISVSRNARVSYMNQNGKRPTVEEDLALYDRLVGSRPLHASPTEHVAQAHKHAGAEFGNFRGWRQLRQDLEVGL